MQSQNGNLSLILGLFILVTVVGSGAYYLGTKQNVSPVNNPSTSSLPLSTNTSLPSPTSQPSSQLQSYSNSKYHYSLEYPQNWKATGVAPGAGNITLNAENNGISIAPSNPETPQLQVNLGIEVTPAKDSGMDFETWVKDAKSSQYYEVKKESSRMIGGVKATVLEGIYGSTGAKTVFLKNTFFHTPDNQYFITITTTDLEDKSSQNDLEQIISSFKFIN